MPCTRCFPVINLICLSTPHVNFHSCPSPSDREQPELSTSPFKKQISQLSDLELKDKSLTGAWACYRRGFGSRHKYGLAVFSLWNPIQEDFRYPIKYDGDWISKTYNATGWETAWPKLRVLTATPRYTQIPPIPSLISLPKASF